MNVEFWSGRKVFLTGHTGFKGSWLSLWLQKLGAEVTGYALPPPTDPSLFEEARVSDGMCSIEGDIRDLDSLKRAMAEACPEIVIHMAAQPLVRFSYEFPVETYATNVMGTVNLLEAIRGTPSVRAVVNVTTDKCYENREWYWGYRENEAMGGYDPYSSSKGCAELVTSAYRQSYFNNSLVAVASARAGNVIGGGDWAKDRLVPDILKAIASGEAVLVRSPHSIRPWQHVLEPLSGYLLLAQRLYEGREQYAEPWNFGPCDEDAKSVEYIVDKLCSFWANGASWKLDGNAHPHEARYLKLDISKARQKLGWEPRWSLDVTLRKIVEWQKQYLSGNNVADVTLQQIEEFTNSKQTRF